jgi:hypothetical protein
MSLYIDDGIQVLEQRFLDNDGNIWVRTFDGCDTKFVLRLVVPGGKFSPRDMLTKHANRILREMGVL